MMIRHTLTVVFISGLALAGAVGSETGIQGRVVIWPVCPVERGTPDCAARPVAARIVISRPSGQQVAALHTRGDGHFQVAVAPGDYRIAAEVAGMLCKPVDVGVPPQGQAAVTVRCDTGIR
jgi:hypothetical protein